MADMADIDAKVDELMAVVDKAIAELRRPNAPPKRTPDIAHLVRADLRRHLIEQASPED
jgi:hypothetical protein